MNKLAFVYLSYIIINLHTLRNVYFVGYATFLVFAYTTSCLYCLSRFKIIRIGPIAVWLGLFLISAFWASLVTTFDYGMEVGVYSTARYFFAIPMTLIGYVLLERDTDVRKFLILFCCVVLFGSLTIPFQYFIGPIWWFSEPSERAGMVRYASLLGSLTVAGGVIPYAFYTALMLKINRFYRTILLMVLVVCACLTLQKAALVGLLMAVGLYILHQDKRKPLIVLRTLSIIVLLIYLLNTFVLSKWLVWQHSLDYISAMFDSSESATMGDVTVQQSVIDRLTVHPLYSLEDLVMFRGELGLFTGGGFGMVGDALVQTGYSRFITAHNGYVDFVLIGGGLHLLAFLGLSITVLLKLKRSMQLTNLNKQEYNHLIILLGLFVMMLINLGFAGSLTFQPAVASVFWVIIGIAWRLEGNPSHAIIKKKQRAAFRKWPIYPRLMDSQKL
jgi:hypothetical protein